MRRLVAIYGLVGLLALGGWGHTLAAAACVHATNAPIANTTTEDHACCRAHVAHAATHHQPAHTVASADGYGHAADSFSAPAAQAAPEADLFCAHCMSSAAPVPLGNVVRAQQTQSRTDAAQALTSKQADTSTRVSVSLLAPRQHAPPPGRGRHLLLSTLLI
ncbi:MAG: hypothetical protein ACJ74W_03215 [Pyrinomonadaceae bacterium]